MSTFKLLEWKPIELGKIPLAIFLVESSEKRSWPNQQQVFALRIPQQGEGMPPLYYELCKACGISVTQSIRQVLDQLVGHDIEENDLLTLVDINGW